MPHFSPTGHDTYICQKCGRIVDSGIDKGQWRTDITGSKSAGMVCTPCVKNHDGAKAKESTPGSDVSISLYEHCRRESGLEGEALRQYINRYYGHG